MALSFSTAAVPVQTRTTNEFLDVVPTMVKGTALSFTVKSETDKEKKALRVMNRQLSEAGTAANVTVRRTTVEKNGETTVTFWIVDKIVHEKKEEKVSTPAKKK